MHIGAISIYPVKSLGPVRISAVEVGERGLAGDRRWMIVDENGRFVTRRDLPDLATIAVEIADEGYRLVHAAGDAPLQREATSGRLTPVSIWRDTCDAIIVDNEASRLVSHVADRPLRLVYMPASASRPVNPAYGRVGEIVSFADAFPVLVVSDASLGALNALLAKPIPMERFRSNIIVSGDMKAWAEESWTNLNVGAVTLRLAKPCSRCIVITQNHETGTREDGNAVPLVLRKLGKFNREGVLFGMNAVPVSPGRIAVGDSVSCD